MNFLRRSAPLAILASGQLFVLVSGGFDLSVGSLVTITVIGGSMLTANDPSKTWWGDRRPVRDRSLCRPRQRRDRRLSADAFVIATLGTLLSVNGLAMRGVAAPRAATCRRISGCSADSCSTTCRS